MCRQLSGLTRKTQSLYKCMSLSQNDSEGPGKTVAGSRHSDRLAGAAVGQRGAPGRRCAPKIKRLFRHLKL